MVQKVAYELAKPILEKTAAKVSSDGAPCVTHIGSDGAGHFVKMIHNGSEYSDSQLIAEAYDLMRHSLNLLVEEMADTFSEWNEGELNSYLIEITADILTKYDGKTGKPMIDVILDSAGNKGTGKWASQAALKLEIPFSIVTESVFARYIYMQFETNVCMHRVYLLVLKMMYMKEKRQSL